MSGPVLVTGASGFVARFLIPRLLSAGYAVRGIDLNPAGSNFGFEHWIGDVRDAKLMKRAMSGVKAVIHLAAAHGDVGIAESEYRSVNVAGMAALLEAATERSVDTFVFFSSIAVYGTAYSVAKEIDEPRPVNPYGATKREAEELLQRWTLEKPSRNTIIVRPALIFGPTNRANMFRLIDAVARRKFVKVGPLTNEKSCAYVENVADATLYLMKKNSTGLGVYNYCDEPGLTMDALVGEISRLFGARLSSTRVPLTPIHAASLILGLLPGIRGGKIHALLSRAVKLNTASRVSAQKIRGEGFRATYTLLEGISRTVDAYRADGGTKKAA